MRKSKKLTTIVITVLCLMLAVTGCGGGASNGVVKSDVPLSGVNEFPIVEEPLTLSIFAVKNAYIEDFVENDFTKLFEEKTNVHLDWNVASGDAQQSFNLMLASGEYTDIVMGMNFTKAAILDYADQEMLVNLEPYIEEHGYYIKQMFEESPNIKEGVTLGGGIYALPKISEGYRYEFPEKMWVYKPWLDKLGIDIPETTEEFYQMLKAFKEKDPNGNGIADEIPLAARGITGNFGIETFLMSAFLPAHYTRVYADENGKMQFSPIQPEYREGLRYLKKLYDEGLLYADTFILDRAQIMSIGENDPVILGAAPGMFAGMFTISNGNSQRYYDYVAIPPIAGPEGVRVAPSIPDAYLGNFAVMSTCKYPDVAVKWVDWLYSAEGKKLSQASTSAGAERREAKEGELGYDGKQAKWAVDKVESTAANDSGMAHSRSWQNFGVWYSKFEDGISVCNYNDVLDKHREWYKAFEAYSKYEDTSFVGDLPIMPDEVGEFNDIKTALEDVNVSFTSFVNGKMSLDTDWDKYVEDLYSLGLERYLEICQNAYDRMK